MNGHAEPDGPVGDRGAKRKASTLDSDDEPLLKVRKTVDSDAALSRGAAPKKAKAELDSDDEPVPRRKGQPTGPIKTGETDSDDEPVFRMSKGKEKPAKQDSDDEPIPRQPAKPAAKAANTLVKPAEAAKPAAKTPAKPAKAAQPAAKAAKTPAKPAEAESDDEPIPLWKASIGSIKSSKFTPGSAKSLKSHGSGFKSTPGSSKFKLRGKLGTPKTPKRSPSPGATRGRKPILLSEADIEPINKWWEHDQDMSEKWVTLEHHGLMFSEEWTPHGVPIRYNGKVVELDAGAEEVLTYWAAVVGTDHEHKPVFRANAWEAIKERLPSDTPVECLDKIDVSAIREHLASVHDARRALSKEQKDVNTNDKAATEGKFKFALVDGLREKRGIFKAETPSLFRGRGEHPKMGQLKAALTPEDVTLNIGHSACVPKAEGMPGHAWVDIVHDSTVTWMTRFSDSIMGEVKYMMLGAGSGWKGQNDVAKYEKPGS